MQPGATAFSTIALLALYALLAASFSAFLILRAAGRTGAVARLEQRQGSTRILKRVFREYWHWLTRPVERILVGRGVSPSQISTTGLVLACGAALLFAAGCVGFAGWTLVLAGTCDIFDGQVARSTGRSERSGAFWDAVLDRIGDAAVFSGILILLRGTPWSYVALLALIGSFMVSYVRARAEAEGVRCDTGLMQRPERVFLLSAASVTDPLLGLGTRTVEPAPPILLCSAVALIAVLSWQTALARVWRTLRALNAPGSGRTTPPA